MDDILHQKQAAALLGVTTRRLRQIDHEDDPPLKVDGKYPTEAFSKWLEARILSRLSIMDDGEVLDYQQERARLTKAQADHEELKVHQMEGTLIPSEEVNQVWTDKIMSARSTLMALPSKIAPVVMSASTVRDVEDFARDEIFHALNELAGAEGNQKAG